MKFQGLLFQAIACPEISQLGLCIISCFCYPRYIQHVAHCNLLDRIVLTVRSDENLRRHALSNVNQPSTILQTVASHQRVANRPGAYNAPTILTFAVPGNVDCHVPLNTYVKQHVYGAEDLCQVVSLHDSVQFVGRPILHVTRAHTPHKVQVESYDGHWTPYRAHQKQLVTSVVCNRGRVLFDDTHLHTHLLLVLKFPAYVPIFPSTHSSYAFFPAIINAAMLICNTQYIFKDQSVQWKKN